MNLYTYCYNQSIRYYDYLGLIPPPETHGGGLTAGGDTRTEIYNSYQEDGRNQEEASDYLKGTLGFFKLPLDSLELFDAEIKKTQQLFRKTGCKFVITYARHGNKSGEKFDTVAVLEEVKKVINNNLNDAIYITSAHEYQIFNNALKSVNCICGVVFIGHAGSTDGPSRLIFDNKTSIATEDRPKATGRFSYKTLYNKNLVTDNLSLLLGCRSASDKRFITKQNKEIVEIEGKYMSIAEAIGIHFQGRVIGSFEKLNFDGGNPYTPIRKGGSDFRLFNSSK